MSVKIHIGATLFGGVATMLEAFKLLAQLKTLDLTQRKEQW